MCHVLLSHFLLLCDFPIFSVFTSVLLINELLYMQCVCFLLSLSVRLLCSPGPVPVSPCPSCHCLFLFFFFIPCVNPLCFLGLKFAVLLCFYFGYFCTSGFLDSMIFWIVIKSSFLVPEPACLLGPHYFPTRLGVYSQFNSWGCLCTDLERKIKQEENEISQLREWTAGISFALRT